MIDGIGQSFKPEFLDLSFIDEIHPIKSIDALAMARKLALEEGMVVGISSGATVKAAIDIGSRPENKGKNIVAIIASFGERYLSTELFSDLTKECQRMGVNHIN